MNSSKFEVLLYSDESQSAFCAVVYAAILLMNMPNMHLTAVSLKESNDGSLISKNDWINSWPTSPTSDWMRAVMGRYDSSTNIRYHEILAKTKEIFTKRAVDVCHHVIYCNPNIPDTVDTLIEFATKNSIDQIVIGTERMTTLKGLIFGSLAHTLQDRSPIPVLLVLKLPQDLRSTESKLFWNLYCKELVL